MNHLEPFASCPLFRPCAPQLAGDGLRLALGLWVSAGLWGWVLVKMGMGRR